MKFKNPFYLDLRSLAIFRMAISGLILTDLFVRAQSLRAHYTDFGLLPRASLIGKFSSPWSASLHFMNGSAFSQAVLFLVAALFAVMLMAGYRTRLATFLSWFMMMSLQARNPMILQAGDVFFRMLLFWSIFLPLGACFSIDSLRRQASADTPVKVISIATAAYLLQVCFVYWFTAALKSLPPSFEVWWKEGMAVYYALSVDQFTKPLGDFFLSLDVSVLKFLNYGTILFEIAGPFLLLMPVFNGFFRMAAIVSFILMHAAFGLSLSLGPFPWVSSIAMLAFLPTLFWEKTLPFFNKIAAQMTEKLRYPFLLQGWAAVKERARVRQGDARGGYFRLSRPGNLFVAACLVYVFFWNLGTVNARYAVPAPLRGVGVLMGLEQKWNMFSPPLKEDGWYVIPGKLRGGKVVDLFRRGKAVSWERPEHVYQLYRSNRERKYMMNIWLAANSKYRLDFGKYLCRCWNSRHQGDELLDEFEVFFMKEYSQPDERVPRPEKVSIWKHWCFEVPKGVKAET